MKTTVGPPPAATSCQTCGQLSPRPLVEVAPGHNICHRCVANFGRGWPDI